MTLFDGPSIYLLQPTGKENHSDAKHNTVGYFYPLSVSLIYFVKGPWYGAASAVAALRLCSHLLKKTWSHTKGNSKLSLVKWRRRMCQK